MATDPICGMYVDEKTATIKRKIKETTYYFCGSNCLVAFEAPEKEMKRLKYEAVFGGIFAAIAGLLFFIKFPYHEWVMLLVTLPVQFVIGRRFYQGTLDALKAKTANMDTLIALGTSAAWFYSAFVVLSNGHGIYFEVAAFIIAATIIGKYFEELMKHKATEALHKLMDLKPKTARILVSGKEVEKPISEIKVGDVCVVKPGEIIPTDGIILEGHSEINEAMVTGESMPVSKDKGDEVIGGTINESGLLKIKATKVGEDTVLSQIISLVGKAQLEKIPIQHVVDKVAAKFVPAVIVVALLSFAYWYFTGQEFIFAFTILISVLIIACPCALGLATPTALLIGIGKAAESGILVRSGEALELAKSIDTIIFDKTGTLTEGKPSVTDVVAFSGSKEDVLRIAAIAEKGSEHPLAKAVLQEASELGINVPDVKNIEAVTGQGVKAKYSNKEILVGNRKLISSSKIDLKKFESEVKYLEEQAKTAAIVAYGKQVIGVIGISDTIKKSSIEAIAKLKMNGKEIIMITGDNEVTANAIAKQAGIDRVLAQVLPKDKADEIKKLQKEGKKVCMVGDGINDAPALAQADLGIAIGSGTDVAKETCEMLQMQLKFLTEQ